MTSTDLEREIAEIGADVLRLTRPRVPEEIVGGRLWAVLMLSRDLETCRSIGAGRRVLSGRLDPEVLRRALRGAPLPDARAYIEIGPDHLDAIAEAGPLRRREEERWANRSQKATSQAHT